MNIKRKILSGITAVNASVGKASATEASVADATPADTSLADAFADIPRLDHGIQRFSSQAKFTDPIDKPRKVVKVHRKLCRLIALLILVMLAGCQTREDKELIQYIKKIKLEQTGSIEELPVLKSAAAIPLLRQDTNLFKAYSSRQTEYKSAIKHKKSLENIPLADLQFTGILQQGSRSWALIRLPDGEVIHLARGEFIGQQKARIIEIGPDFLKLDEIAGLAGKQKKKTHLVFFQNSK